MLQIPRLDNLNYTALFERAKAMIPSITDDWTDLNYHDPGITTLQTFAWLYDMLSYYMNATGEQHRLKYLKLLGIKPQERTAKCLVSVNALEEPVTLLSGSKLYAEQTCFQTEESVTLLPNRLKRLYNLVNEVLYDLTVFVSGDDDQAEIFTLDNTTDTAIYLGFERPIAKSFSLYVMVKDIGRNPFDKDFYLSKLVWEYYTKSGWIEADAVIDETCGFLKDGFIRFELSVPAEQLSNDTFEEGYYLRCCLLENEFDLLPSISRIELNSFFVRQCEDTAVCLELTATGEAEIEIDQYIPNDYLITVAVAKKDEDTYTCAFLHEPEETDRCEIIAVGENKRAIRFSEGNIPGNKDKLLVCAVDAEFLSESMLSYTDGTAGQRIEFVHDDVCEIRVALVDTDENDRYTFTLWEQCDDISCASYDEKKFSYIRDENVIKFGDNTHGLVPEPGLGVMVLGLATSLFEKGNILKGQLTYSRELPELAVSNPAPAFGGKRRETAAELQMQISERINGARRAVTEEDYREIIRNTPGLLLDEISVITMREYSDFYGVEYRPNTVIAAVKPVGHSELPTLSQAYSRRISEHIMPYRLLTTDIEIISCGYVGIHVYGRVTLHEDNEASRRQVLECVKNMTDHVSPAKFGEAVDFGRLFSALEMVESVRSIAELSLECVGLGGRKNEQGDIIVFKDSMSYLKEMGIEFSYAGLS